MSACIVECDQQEPGEQIWFPSEFEAEQATYGSDCCVIKPVGDDYDGPRWVSEDEESE